MYTCQCEGFQVGKSNGILLKEVATYWSCPLIEVSLYTDICISITLQLSTSTSLYDSN